MLHRFKNGEHALIHSTGNPEMYGMNVTVVGVVLDCYPIPGSVYIIRVPWGVSEWDTITLTESCLRPITM